MTIAIDKWAKSPLIFEVSLHAHILNQFKNYSSYGLQLNAITDNIGEISESSEGMLN